MHDAFQQKEELLSLLTAKELLRQYRNDDRAVHGLDLPLPLELQSLLFYLQGQYLPVVRGRLVHFDSPGWE
jgi:hypothetical protein